VTARELSALPLPDPTVPTPAHDGADQRDIYGTLPGSKSPTVIPYTLEVGSTATAGFFFRHPAGGRVPPARRLRLAGSATDSSKGSFIVAVKNLPVSPYEMSVIDARLQSPAPGRAAPSCR